MSSREAYSIPNSYENLDELAAPSPIDDPYDHRRNVWEERNSKDYDLERQPTGDSRRPDISALASVDQWRDPNEEEYNIPDDYANLDELNTPSPVQSNDEERQQGHLEDRLPIDDDAGQLQTQETWEIRDRGKGRNGHLAGHLDASPTDRRDRSPLATEGSSPSTSQSGTADIHRKGSSPLHRRASKLATELYTVSYLIFFSILGTLARLGLQALTFYPGAPVQTGLLWANVGGSLILGFLSEDRKLFRGEWGPTPPRVTEEKRRDGDEHGSSNDHNSLSQAQAAAAKNEHATLKKTIPLYIGVAIGFCGSCTSFSSFILDAFLALSNALPVPISHSSSTPISPSSTVSPNPGYSLLAVLAVLIITVTACLGAFQFGAHLAVATEPFMPSIPFIFARKFVDRSMAFISWTSWLAAIIMAVWPPDRPGGPADRTAWAQETWRGDALYALVFAPMGCLLRFYASLHLNGRLQSFPLGTFAVNMLGTAMEGMFFDLQHAPVGAGTRVGCQVLQGGMDGFCGCLTTVSTWVAELKGLRMRHAYKYGAVSMGMGLGLMVVIVGSLQWTAGLLDPDCRT